MDAPHSPAIFGPMLLDYWNQQYLASGRDNRPMSKDGARFRHSWAGWCARKIQYSLEEFEGRREFDTPSTPPADRWRLEMGTIVHDYWEAALGHCFPEAEIEHATTHALDGDFFSAGHGDAMVVDPKFGRICIELKSRNGFGYKMDIGANKTNTPEGPATSAKRQGALNALAEDADVLVVLHISLEAVGPNQMPAPLHGDPYQAMRMTAEWWYPREEYEPWAIHELKRVNKIIELSDNEGLAPRSVPEDMPPGARIVNVNTAEWHLETKTDDGTPVVSQRGVLWNGRFCDYCKFQATCEADGA